MKQTTNLKLNKPEYSDYADISVLNDNMDKVDTEVDKCFKKAGGIITGDVTLKKGSPRFIIQNTNADSLTCLYPTNSGTTEVGLWNYNGFSTSQIDMYSKSRIRHYNGSWHTLAWDEDVNNCLKVDGSNTYNAELKFGIEHAVIRNSNNYKSDASYIDVLSGTTYDNGASLTLYQNGYTGTNGLRWRLTDIASGTRRRMYAHSDGDVHLDNYGLTMNNGTIKLNGDSTTIHNLVDNKSTEVYGGTTWDNGGMLKLWGKDSNSGNAELRSAGGVTLDVTSTNVFIDNKVNRMFITPEDSGFVMTDNHSGQKLNVNINQKRPNYYDGSTWFPVVTQAWGDAEDYTLRLSNGNVKIQSGIIANGSGGATVTFKTPFDNNFVRVVFSPITSGNDYTDTSCKLTYVNSTGFRVMRTSGESNFDYEIRWIAIGMA